MRHIMGNSTNCSECRWYKEKEAGVQCRGDGWCHNPKHLRIGINGRKLKNPPEREPKLWNSDCSWWEDAEYPYINHFEAATHSPDPSRSPVEQMIIAEAIRQAEEEQEDLDAYYRKKKMRHFNTQEEEMESNLADKEKKEGKI